jgi:glycosyltransferase involved in cell wall biosynthesis
MLDLLLTGLMKNLPCVISQKRKPLELITKEDNAFVGRISEEKGIMDLPFIYSKVKEQIPDLEIVIAGKGPEEEKLRSLLPRQNSQAGFPRQIPELYSAADILILPQFDTFGNVIVEAFSCGCPVVSYNTKGPKDIIENEKSGYLVNTREKMAEVITNFFLKNKRTEMSQSALLRSKDFTATNIIEKLLKDTGLL